VSGDEIDQLSPEPRYLQLAAILRGQIERGELRSGDALPSQATMVQRYGVARMTASRAVRLLVNEGLAVIVPGMGAFVARRLGISRPGPFLTAYVKLQRGSSRAACNKGGASPEESL
jgi:GntR family transcriptional regulator